MKNLIARCLVAGLLTASLSAEFEVQQTSEEIAERGPVLRLLIQSSAGGFAFNPPPGWSLTQDKEEQSLTLTLDQAEAVLVAKFSTNAPPKAPKLAAFIERQWPGAQIRERAPVFSRGASGESTEFTYPSAASTPYRTRLAILPCARGHLALQLTAPDDWPPRLHHAWTLILNSLRPVPDAG